jgi:hypothetical protein
MSFDEAAHDIDHAAAKAARPRRRPLFTVSSICRAILYTFVNLQAIQLPSSGEKRNDFVLKDLKVNPADVADIFMVPTSQLHCLEFFVEP